MTVWRWRRRTSEVIDRAEEVNGQADDTFRLLARTVVDLHKTTKELERALEELTADDAQ